MNSNQIEKSVYSRVIDSTSDFTTTETTEETIKRTTKTKLNLEEIEREIKEITRKAIKEELQKQTKVVSVLRIRECDYMEAKKEILELIDKHPGGISSLEISETLSLDPVVVLKALCELKEEGKIGKVN